MLRSRNLFSIHQDISKLYLHLSSNLHTRSICNRKERNDSECDMKSVAVVLCGCGALDGTEISEAVSVAIHCSQKGFKPKFYAPDIEICDIVDHYCKKTSDESRNALSEAARIARSSIKPLCECDSSSGEALIIPGGFGVAKTLSNFMTAGAECTILPDLERVIKEFSCEKKPIGAICIAAALIAKVLKGVKITLGKDGPLEEWPHQEAIEQVRKMGAMVEKKDVTGVTYCKQHNVYSTPAWMYNAATHSEIHLGIGKLITEICESIE